jgi:hypothetical protein
MQSEDFFSPDWKAKNVPLPIHSIQGGSDKSGIFLFYLLNDTTQLKIIRFYCSEKKIADIQIEN